MEADAGALPTGLEDRGERRELGESDATKEILNCPLFFRPTIGMEVTHACEEEHGGRESRSAVK